MADPADKNTMTGLPTPQSPSTDAEQADAVNKQEQSRQQWRDQTAPSAKADTDSVNTMPDKNVSNVSNGGNGGNGGNSENGTRNASDLSEILAKLNEISNIELRESIRKELERAVELDRQLQRQRALVDMVKSELREQKNRYEVEWNIQQRQLDVYASRLRQQEQYPPFETFSLGSSGRIQSEVNNSDRSRVRTGMKTLSRRLQHAQTHRDANAASSAIPLSTTQYPGQRQQQVNDTVRQYNVAQYSRSRRQRQVDASRHEEQKHNERPMYAVGSEDRTILSSWRPPGQSKITKSAIRKSGSLMSPIKMDDQSDVH